MAARTKKAQPLPPSLELIERAIYLIRGQKVMLDADLAELYGVETKVLLQAVRRNKKRFPLDFAFRLTAEEWCILRSQIVTSKRLAAAAAIIYDYSIMSYDDLLRSQIVTSSVDPVGG